MAIFIPANGKMTTPTERALNDLRTALRTPANLLWGNNQAKANIPTLIIATTTATGKTTHPMAEDPSHLSAGIDTKVISPWGNPMDSVNSSTPMVTDILASGRMENEQEKAALNTKQVALMKAISRKVKNQAMAFYSPP